MTYSSSLLYLPCINNHGWLILGTTNGQVYTADITSASARSPLFQHISTSHLLSIHFIHGIPVHDNTTDIHSMYTVLATAGGDLQVKIAPRAISSIPSTPTILPHPCATLCVATATCEHNPSWGPLCFLTGAADGMLRVWRAGHASTPAAQVAVTRAVDLEAAAAQLEAGGMHLPGRAWEHPASPSPACTAMCVIPDAAGAGQLVVAGYACGTCVLYKLTPGSASDSGELVACAQVHAPVHPLRVAAAEAAASAGGSWPAVCAIALLAKPASGSDRAHICVTYSHGMVSVMELALGAGLLSLQGSAAAGAPDVPVVAAAVLPSPLPCHRAVLRGDDAACTASRRHWDNAPGCADAVLLALQSGSVLRAAVTREAAGLELGDFSAVWSSSGVAACTGIAAVQWPAEKFAHVWVTTDAEDSGDERGADGGTVAAAAEATQSSAGRAVQYFALPAT